VTSMANLLPSPSPISTKLRIRANTSSGKQVSA
jgi:hypothetical protein